MLDSVLRTVLPVLAAVVAALAVDRLAIRRGEAAPGFFPPTPGALARRLAATAMLASVLYLGVFLPFALTEAPDLDLSAVAPWELFTLHVLLGATLLAWGGLGHAALGAAADGRGRPGGATPPEAGTATGTAVPGREDGPLRGGAEGADGAPGAGAGTHGSPESPPLAAAAPPPLHRRIADAFRLREAHLAREVGLGLLAGVAIWAAVIFALGVFATALYALGFDDWLPQGPPELVTFIAAQPLWLRIAGSLSAGFFEETFFRGFLQPRVGIVLSTLLFALAHWSYGEPFMLVGVTLLSVTYALLARWRGSVWAAVTAHAVFDGVQLLVLVPLALKAVESGLAPAAWAWLTAALSGVAPFLGAPLG